MKIFFDASYRPARPKEARYGFVVYDASDMTIFQGAGRVIVPGGRLDSHYAEIIALGKAIDWARPYYSKNKVEFFGDSDSVISLIRGESKAIKNRNYYKQLTALRRDVAECKYWSFHWIGRWGNWHADQLAQIGKPISNQFRRWAG